MAHLQGQEKARYVAAMFARVARRYDFMNTVMTGGMHHRWRRLAAAIATRGVTGPALDVATGTGDFAFELARLPQTATVAGLDFCGEMVQLAEAKARRNGLRHKATFVTGDALALPFSDNVFACVTCGFALRNVSDLSQALREMVRVTRPGGRVVLLEIIPLRGRGFFDRLFPLYFRHVTPWLGAFFAGDRETFTYLPESVQNFFDAGELARVIENAGLQNVDFRKVGLGTVAIYSGAKPL